MTRPAKQPARILTTRGLPPPWARRTDATWLATLTAMLISCMVSSSPAHPRPGLEVELPLIASSGPGEVVWTNPAPLARAGRRVWLRVGSSLGTTTVSGGATLPLPWGLPVFCTSQIGPVARACGLDSALAAALVAVESGFNPRAVSPTGARGLTQLTRRTARSLGVYNRHWPSWNLWGGFTYLAQMRARFGDDDLALAAYLVGPEVVQQRGSGVLRDPHVASYVSSVRRLRKAYATQYPARCVPGGNALGVALVDSARSKALALGWGMDLQPFLEVGASGMAWHDTASHLHTRILLGARAYVVDPLILAVTYLVEKKTTRVGALACLNRERLLVGGQWRPGGKATAAIKLALPLHSWVEAKSDGTHLHLAASLQWRVLVLEYGQTHGPTGKRHTAFLSLGLTPSL